MAKQTGPERVKEMVTVLQEWQGIERQALTDTAEIIEQSENPLVRIIMEIIRHDSLMHHRVQQFLIDSVTRENVTLTREDLAEVWTKIQEHDEHEKKTIELAEVLLAKAWNPIHKQLLTYLITDEKKHDALIGQLEEVKAGMAKSSGA